MHQTPIGCEGRPFHGHAGACRSRSDNRFINNQREASGIRLVCEDGYRVDLRFKNQVIIKMNDDEAGEKIVWGVKKDTL